MIYRSVEKAGVDYHTRFSAVVYITDFRHIGPNIITGDLRKREPYLHCFLHI